MIFDSTCISFTKTSESNLQSPTSLAVVCTGPIMPMTAKEFGFSINGNSINQWKFVERWTIKDLKTIALRWSEGCFLLSLERTTTNVGKNEMYWIDEFCDSYIERRRELDDGIKLYPIRIISKESHFLKFIVSNSVVRLLRVMHWISFTPVSVRRIKEGFVPGARTVGGRQKSIFRKYWLEISVDKRDVIQNATFIIHPVAIETSDDQGNYRRLSNIWIGHEWDIMLPKVSRGEIDHLRTSN